MKNVLKIKCIVCGTQNLIPVDEMLKRSYTNNGGQGVLCHKCCKKANWFSEKICKNCSEFRTCKYGIKSELKPFTKEKGVL